MANSPKPQLPYHKRVQDAVDEIGTVNGTKLADPVLPDSIDAKNNVEVNEFFERHALVKEFLVLDILNKHIEGRHKAAKKNLLMRFNINENALTAGDTRTYALDNVSLSYKVTNGRALLNKETLLVILMSRLDKLVPGAKNLSLDEAQNIINEASVKGKPPLSLIPATIAE